ncbi:putative phosphate transport protein (TIGR00153 family) [Solibacillus kalamii]|uniref:Phosphate transport regulator n=4 Tax=Solibacillus TaxID=648800 RepID=F2F695_SOLSS|nr:MULTISPECIES: DUF47 domain-containing protein [Solibacillus]AMO87176.1 hypothetical protein SOLI23_16980 [Solibacillus silvestris]EKB45263.1 Phosphate transport regulator [Solibacillus isronensis B3W22]MBM7666380.1 putative phosphate transport protein (TIGR00153 family) [Solibacillus kalamii]MCM3723755.1 DUF47 domain-containing protein [Solibacillus isronensis]OBW59533.1 hypothetical protein A9986_17770 [Solibacillus silvestris]
MFSSKKQDPFFSALLKIAENMREGIHYANDFRIETVADLKEISIRMKQYETAGDKLIHELIVMLNKSFMTPIEREDILSLAIRMDDVLDGAEGTIAHFEMFSLTEIDESMRDFLAYIAKSTDEIVKAMELLNKKDLVGMRQHAILIKDYERECDEVLRSSIKKLFLNEKDPIRLIKFKDIYEQLEEIADYCQTVANTIETIIMRNA